MEDPKFYNYNEYREFNAEDSGSPLVITHYPCPYPPVEGLALRKDQIRIVRVPRLLSTDYPQFSTAMPGMEDAAINPQHTAEFVPVAQHDGQWFGTTSVSPLSRHLSSEELEQIVTQINHYLATQYSSNPLFTLVNVLTFGLLSACRLDKQSASSLEEYVAKVNQQFAKDGKLCRIVSPRLSGYLSLDFEIPEPLQ